ncbi:MAG: hypothetical protein M5U12_09555 [Verrucomicrobia bacterium]|nr:hypothetical protein [Verrucomicrobiota bacterium]
MSSTAPAPTRRPVAALQHPTRVQVTKEDQRNILRAYVTCRSAEQRAEIYGEAVDPIYADGSQIDFSRAPIEASNVLGSVVGDIVSRRTLELMVSNRPLIDGVLTDFSSEAVAKNQTVYTRSVALPPVADFGAAASDTADTDYPVTLSNHKQVLYSFTASEYLSTSRNLVEERAQANAESLGDHLVDSVAALITDAFSSETTGAAAGKEFSDVLAAAAALNAAGARPFGVPCGSTANSARRSASRPSASMRRC